MLACTLGLGGRCGGGSGPFVTLTLNAIPDGLNDLLVLPPSGFTLDVAFPEPAKVLAASLSLEAVPFGPGSPVDLTGAIVVSEPDRAVALVPSQLALAPGSYQMRAQVQRLTGAYVSASLDVAVRNPASGPPLATPQWVQLDLAADRDGDLAPDLPDDLEHFGLGSPADPASSQIVHDWVAAEIVSRVQALYDDNDPSGLPGGDLLDLDFSDAPPASGPYTRVCVGGEDPTGGSTLGNVLFDAGNANPADVACSNALPSGVFPRELLVYQNDPVFDGVFDPLLATPVGTHALDPVVLGPGYDPGDPGQLARYQAIELGVTAFAQGTASVAAHEVGHALGLVPPGEPGGGLFGGASGPEFTHNVQPGGSVTPAENLLMNKGASFAFAELAGLSGFSPPRMRETNFAYLAGRLVLDPKVTGIFPPPSAASVTPAQISLGGPSVIALSVTGADFLATPQIRLNGPLLYQVISEALVDSTRVDGFAVVFQLLPGLYDVEVENPDGQVAVLDDALEVVP